VWTIPGPTLGLRIAPQPWSCAQAEAKAEW
jgi:hypothetical protein